jgi:predicted SAM-dependent methyltransferase
MLPRAARTAFYVVAGPARRFNGWLYRVARAPRSGNVCVQLGPGRENYLKGWNNVDADMFTSKCDVWADLRNPLPFRNNSVSAMHSHHVIEHLANPEGHFSEVYRCLKPGGIYRVGVPNGDSAIKKFISGDYAWFGDWPDKRRSIGGRFENFIFCRGEHVTISTYSFLEELAQDAGFGDIREHGPVNRTGYPDFFRDAMTTEWESDFKNPHTLVIECRKPTRDV